MLVGNMCDRTLERQVSFEEGLQLAKQLGCEFIETSAKLCINVEKAYFDVVRQIRKEKEGGELRDKKRSRRRLRQCSIL